MNDRIIWEPIRKVKAHVQALEQIEEQILNGTLRSGSKLPSERDLAAMLDVSRPSVREALRALGVLGIVDSNPGSGEDSGSVISNRTGESLAVLIQLSVALSNIGMAELVDVRVKLEQRAAYRAAARRTEVDIAEIWDTVERMHQAGEDPAQLSALSADFHLQVARASGNRLIIDLVEALRSASRAGMDEVVGDPVNWSQFSHALTMEHTDIFNAIEAGDGETAAKLIGSHISRFYEDRVC